MMEHINYTTVTVKGILHCPVLVLQFPDSAEGPYTNEGIMLKSGMSASEKDEDGNLYQATTDPNVVGSCCIL